MSAPADPLQSHIDTAAPPGSAEALALVFSPPQSRRAIGAILAFAHELSGIARLSAEAAPMRLNWWREELGRLVHGQPGHPVTRALLAAELIDEPSLRRLGQISQAASMEIAGTSYRSIDDLTVYLDRGFVTVQTLIATVGGHDVDTMLPTLRHIGHGVGMARIATRTKRDVSNGTLRLPLDIVAAAVAELDAALDAPGPQPLTGTVLAALYRRRITDDARPRPLRDLWLAWQTARRTA